MCYTGETNRHGETPMRHLSIILTIGMLAISASSSHASMETKAETSRECSPCALQEKAEQGDADAQYTLAEDFYPHNKAEAVKWYRKAAAQGHAKAQLRLGIHYYVGPKETRDEHEAAKCFQHAVEQGSPIAHFYLAYCYKRGIGVAQNLEKAKDLFHKGAQLGDDMSEDAYNRILKSEKCKKQAPAPNSQTGRDYLHDVDSVDGAMCLMRLAWDSAACVVHGELVQKDGLLTGKINEVYKGELTAGKAYACQAPDTLFQKTENAGTPRGELYILAKKARLAEDGTYLLEECIVIERCTYPDFAETCFHLVLKTKD